jgi:hypothetical protein
MDLNRTLCPCILSEPKAKLTYNSLVLSLLIVVPMPTVSILSGSTTIATVAHKPAFICSGICSGICYIHRRVWLLIMVTEIGHQIEHDFHSDFRDDHIIITCFNISFSMLHMDC